MTTAGILLTTRSEFKRQSGRLKLSMDANTHVSRAKQLPSGPDPGQWGMPGDGVVLDVRKTNGSLLLTRQRGGAPAYGAAHWRGHTRRDGPGWGWNFPATPGG